MESSSCDGDGSDEPGLVAGPGAAGLAEHDLNPGTRVRHSSRPHGRSHRAALREPLATSLIQLGLGPALPRISARCGWCAAAGLPSAGRWASRLRLTIEMQVRAIELACASASFLPVPHPSPRGGHSKILRHRGGSVPGRAWHPQHWARLYGPNGCGGTGSCIAQRIVLKWNVLRLASFTPPAPAWDPPHQRPLLIIGAARWPPNGQLTKS